MLTRKGFLAGGAALLGGLAAGYRLWPRMDGYRAAAEAERRPVAGGDDLAELVRLGTLAANGHNTQPWTFAIAGGRVTVRPDFSRRTPVVDPDDHHLFVSLGCAVENIALAAPSRGRAAAAVFQGGPDPRIEIDFATVPPAESPLARAIPERQSTRATFDGRPVSAEDLRLLRAAAEEAGVALRIFTEAREREAILDFVIAGNSAQMDDPAFVAELRHWIRLTPDQALASRDGLFAATSGAPVVPAWLAAPLFGLFVTKDRENTKYRDHVRSSAGIAVFLAEKEDPEHWVAVGRAFQRFALQATALGIRTAHVNQPVEVPAVRPDFAAWLGLPGRRPDLVIRFGRGPTLPMALRRHPADVILRG